MREPNNRTASGAETGAGREWGKLESALTLAVVVLFLVVFLPVEVAYWPWANLILLLCGLGALGVRGRMTWEHHRLDIAHRRNKLIVIHDTDQGFGYLGPDGVQGYSHNMSGIPPFDPALLGMGMGEAPEPRAKYPKTFKEMLDRGYIAPGADLIPAFDQETGEPIRIQNPTATGMSGLPGAGKTVTTSLLMIEMVAKWNGRVRFLVVDPHMDVEGEESLLSKIGPLSPYFLTVDEVASTVPGNDRDYRNLLSMHQDLPAVVSGGPELGVWMNIVSMEQDRRKHGKVGDEWVIVIDEFASVMDGPQSKVINHVLTLMNQEARKMHMIALLISQNWKASTVGGTDIRQSIPAFIIHNTNEQVVKLFAPADVARQADGLDVGQVIVRMRGKSLTGKVPMVTEYDAQKLMELYPPVSRVQISEVRSKSGGLDDGKTITQKLRQGAQRLLAPAAVDGNFTELTTTTGREDAGPPMDEDGRPEMEHLEEIRDLFGEGWNPPDIAKRVYGVRSGPDLAEARLKVDRAIRWVVANGR